MQYCQRKQWQLYLYGRRAYTSSCRYRNQPKKRVEEGLKALDIKGEELSGILITHEHIDHVQGLGVFSRKYEVPIYATKGTIEGIKKDFQYWKDAGRIIP